MALSEGTRLGPYEILEPLGAGGMGEVYRARDTRLDRTVAIKVLPEDLAESPERKARFEREAKAISQLNHPNVCTLHDVGEQDGTDYLVMEYIEGETLAERIARGPVPVDEAIPLFVQIAEGLEAAHKKGIIHRDLKPANVTIAPDGNPKILDFGLAKAYALEAPASGLSEWPTAARGTAMGVILGTAPYMSPEQARGTIVDKRTDIWAFGCCFYEALTGRPAFVGETVSDTIAAILQKEPDWQALSASTPAAARRLLRRCLQKDRSKRLHDIADARIEMDEGEDETDAAGRSASQAAPSWWRLVPWVSVAAVVVATLVVFSGDRASKSEVTRFVLNLPEGVFFISGSGVTVSPDGRTVVYSARDGADVTSGGQRLYRHDVDSLESAPIRGTEGGRWPFFSHDGASVGFFVGSELKKTSLSGGVPVLLAEVVGQPDLGDGALTSAGTWLEDDSIVFGSIRRAGQHLSRVSASGGEPSAVAPFTENGEEAWHSYPAAIPGGRGFVSTGRSGDSSWVYLHRPGPGDPVRLVRGGRARVSPTGHLVFEQDGTLWVVVLDIEQATISGEAVPVVESFGSTTTADSMFDRSAFDVSANGTLAYATAAAVAYANRVLFWVNHDGREEPLDIEAKPYWFPHVSPDGDRIGFHIMNTENMDFHIHDLRSGATSRFTFDQAADGYPLWSPDGELVVFWSARGTGVMNLFTRPADGTGRVERLTESRNPQAPYTWANDGLLVLFEEYSAETSADIWKVAISGDHTPEPVLHEPYAERRPAVSPDGRWIAYQSNESGQWQIWVRPFPDVESGRWPVGTGGMSPKWSPDGRELYYRGDSALMAARIDTTDGFSPGPAVRQFEDRYVIGSARVNPYAGQYAVAPDGRFLMMKELPQSQVAAELIVVLNWLEELKAKMREAEE